MKYWKLGMFVFGICLQHTALASEIMYHGMNPQISPSANPQNETATMDFANISRPAQNLSSESSTLSESALLKQSVISGLSSNYLQTLTGTTSGTGSLNFGDGSYANYSTVGNVRTITFLNTITGQSTTISFPLN